MKASNSTLALLGVLGGKSLHRKRHNLIPERWTRARLFLDLTLKRQGYGLDKAATKAASLFGLESDAIFAPGKYRSAVQARSVFCYWAVRELGETATTVARKLHLSQAAVSISVKRGEKIARKRGFSLMKK